MSYNHGIRVEEVSQISEPIQTNTSAVIVVTGTAPINLLSDPASAVNKPILANSFTEAKNKLGYSDDFSSYTLCEVMDAAFNEFSIGPVVFINVLDPDSHKQTVSEKAVTVKDGVATLDEQGILLHTVTVKNSEGTTTYRPNTDYLLAFDENNAVKITVLSSGTIESVAELKVGYDKLNPSAVNKTDIIGGYSSESNVYSGLELIKTIYPTLGVKPNLLLAPGFSHEKEVGAILVAKSYEINGCFKAKNILDLPGKTKENAIENKALLGYSDASSILCFPKTKINNKTYHYSTIFACATAAKDFENESVPFKSPSNYKINIDAMVNDEGTELFLDQLEGNVLNAYGIVTAINMNGWRTWGNNTAAYEYDPTGEKTISSKDRFIAVGRMFDWWANTFIEEYFDKVDDPTDTRLIENLVDEENIRANRFKAKGQIAGAEISFVKEENPISEIMNGKISFKQKAAFFTPAEEIVNEFSFNPSILSEALGAE